MFVVVPLLFFVPGLVVCALLGMRGWRLAGLAPAVTFGLAATGGPLLDALGVRWSLWSFAAWTVVAGVVAAAAAWLWSRLRPGSRTEPAEGDRRLGPPRPAPGGHVGVAGGGLLGLAGGGRGVGRGARRGGR